MSRRIVVLDANTLTAANPGDRPVDGEPHWEPIESLGELTVHPRTPPEQVVERARGFPIVLTNKAKLGAETLEALPELEYIGVLATGTNIVDLESARQRGVVVTNVPGYSGPSVAQQVFALLLELTNHTSEHSRAVHESRWMRSPDFSFTVAPITELAGKTLGVVGLGDIGRRVARIGQALGMEVAVHTRTQREFDVPVRWMGLDELFEAGDVISLHCPLTDETHHLINAQRLERMKPTAILINTSRGPVVDESALASALQEGRIGGAGLDVLSEEPPASGSPLIGAPRCVITPHNAWASQAARRRLMQAVADNIRAFMSGEPINVVNG